MAVHSSLVLCKLIQAKNRGKMGSDTFNLDSVKRKVITTGRLTIPAVQSVEIKGLAHIKGHTKPVNGNGGTT